MSSWYSDLDAMRRDDAYLQAIYQTLRSDMPRILQACIQDVHVYPSLRCTYTIAKKRIFIRVRDDNGNFMPACALRHILIHELAHIVNVTVGHDQHFYDWMDWIRDHQTGHHDCPNSVPRQYNPCTD